MSSTAAAKAHSPRSKWRGSSDVSPDLDAAGPQHPERREASLVGRLPFEGEIMPALDLVKHVVIIVKENHTFDNYFGTFPGANGAQFPHAGDPTPDPPHDHRAWLKRNGPTGAVHLQYTQRDIPAYWAYAQQYTLCDNYFTDVASQSEPNHLYLIAAASPIIDNATPSRKYQPQPPYNLPSLPAALDTAGLQWRDYANPMESYFRHISGIAASASNVP